MNTREVPERVFELLLAGFVSHWADWQVMTLRNGGGYTPGDVVHPGDPFGLVLAWLWAESPDAAAMFVAHYMACLRQSQDLTDDDGPRIQFDDLLRCLDLALPEKFAEADSLIARLCADVPSYYGGDLNP